MLGLTTIDAASAVPPQVPNGSCAGEVDPLSSWLISASLLLSPIVGAALCRDSSPKDSRSRSCALLPRDLNRGAFRVAEGEVRG